MVSDAQNADSALPISMRQAIVLAFGHATDASEWSVDDFLASLRHDGFEVTQIDGSGAQ